MVDIHIREMRLSTIWALTMLDLLASDNPTDPLNYIRRGSSYRQHFASINKDKVSADLQLPWQHPRKHKYWVKYLACGEGKSLRDIDPGQAWRGLVPLRKRIRILAPALETEGGRAILEAFFYPHGLGLVFTAVCKGNFTLKGAVERVFKLKASEPYTLQWGDQDKEQVTGSALPEHVFARLREQYLGSTPAEAISAEPFTVVTITKAEGVDLNAPVEAGGPIQRAFEAVTRWNPTWENDNPLPDLSKSSLGLRRSPTSHVLYATRRGRAVWLPYPFTEGSGVTSSLNCYHRNLVSASLQTESLCGLITEVANRRRTGFRLPSGVKFSAAQLACAKNAADMLGLIYGGKRQRTYRSRSPRAQIEQNGYAEDINEVREYFDLSTLHAEE